MSKQMEVIKTYAKDKDGRIYQNGFMKVTRKGLLERIYDKFTKNKK